MISSTRLLRPRASLAAALAPRRSLVRTTKPCGCSSNEGAPAKAADGDGLTQADGPTSQCARHSEASVAKDPSFSSNGEHKYDIDHLLAANVAWAEENKEWFNRHGEEKHSPKYLWIGCSDARVPANQVIGEPVGAVFVHRNIANMVVSADMNIKSVLQYAVSVLCVPHIIVCGHYDCGGIRAAMAKSSLDSHALGSPIEDWLHNVRDVQRLHADELDAISDPELKHRRLVELNVIEQCLNIFKLGVVQRRRHMTSKVKGTFPQPRVHGLVYEPTTGRLVNLAHDFRAERKKLGRHYELFL